MSKLSRKFSDELSSAKLKNHQSSRGVTKQRKAKRDREIKSSHKVNKRIRLVFTFMDSIKKNKDLYEEIKGINIPVLELKKWMSMETSDGYLINNYLKNLDN
ncbi:MAG: hypothetical protein ACRC0V_12405 [Fusobacteriaceae bacterium]